MSGNLSSGEKEKTWDLSLFNMKLINEPCKIRSRVLTLCFWESKESEEKIREPV